MSIKIGFWLLWLVFISYAFIFAPPDQPDTLELIINLSTGKLTGINPLVIALFNLMGILPMIYACMTLIDGRGQKIPAWLFTTASFAVGAFALLPYLGLRESNPQFPGQKNLLIKLLDARLTGFILTIGAVILVAYGVSQGDWSGFFQQWRTSRFIHVMSLDFLTLCLVFPALLSDDMARRNLQNKPLFWVAALIPLFGALLYLCLRPPLPETIIDDGKKLASTT